MENIVFRNNSAGNGAGALNIEEGGNITLVNVSCIGNKIPSSGYYFASVISFSKSQATRIINSYFYGNVGSLGTVVYASTIGNEHYINNTIFDSNKVDGNIYTSSSTVYIDNSKIINTINATNGYATVFINSLNITISRTLITGMTKVFYMIIKYVCR